MRIEAEAALAADVDRVWALVTDWERQGEWMPDVARVRVVGRERGMGAVVEARTKVLGVPLLTDTLRVVGWEPPTRLAIEHAGLVSGRGEWRLTPAGPGATRFRWVEDLRLPPPIVGEIGLRLYGPVQRAMLRRSLRNLRRLVESRG